MCVSVTLYIYYTSVHLLDGVTLLGVRILGVECNLMSIYCFSSSVV